jgi:hypothetical protein
MRTVRAVWRRPLLLWAAGLLIVGGLAAWRWQSEIIGVGARLYLGSIAAREEASGALTERRAAVARTQRMLLMGPPPDALVPELFDLITAVSSRVATGEIDLNWAAYVYTSYQRDLVAERPSGTPRRSMAEIETVVAEYVRFYSLRKRPDQSGIRLRDLGPGAPPDSYTVEEIERAMREGRKLPGE